MIEKTSKSINKNLSNPQKNRWRKIERPKFIGRKKFLDQYLEGKTEKWVKLNLKGLKKSTKGGRSCS